MKLYMSVNSPYVRMVRVLLREAGAADAAAEIGLNPRDAATGFWAVNPVAKIPALDLGDGTVLTESDLICRHLDARFAGGRFHAALDADAGRLALFGLVRGVLDRGVAARTDQLRPEGPDRAAFAGAQLQAVARGCAALDGALPALSDQPDMLDIAVACAVAWLDFRHPSLAVLHGRPTLARWCDRMASRASMTATAPE